MYTLQKIGGEGSKGRSVEGDLEALHQVALFGEEPQRVFGHIQLLKHHQLSAITPLVNSQRVSLLPILVDRTSAFRPFLLSFPLQHSSKRGARSGVRSRRDCSRTKSVLGEAVESALLKVPQVRAPKTPLEDASGSH